MKVDVSKEFLLLYTNMDVVHPARIMAKKPKKKINFIKNKNKSKKYTTEIYRFFIPYTGVRWEIPCGLTVSDSVRNKFRLLETFYPSAILNKLKYSMKGHQFMFNSLPYSIVTDIFGDPVKNTWLPPESVVSSINNYMKKEINDWKIVNGIYRRLFKMKQYINGLIHRWRIRKARKNIKNVEDPVTLEVPKKCVYVLDFQKGLSYVYEASTIRKTIESRILQSDYMFPCPLDPVNPFTNEEFTRGQLMSIISQCKKHGEFSWILDRLYACECDINVFVMRFKQPLKINAIENHFNGSIHKYKDEVFDFFELEAEREELPDHMVNKFALMLKLRESHPFIIEWIKLTKDLYIARELHDLITLSQVALRTTKLIIQAYHLFN